jgi:trimethylamine--corrinoid protein Co-methyltransferase
MCWSGLAFAWTTMRAWNCWTEPARESLGQRPNFALFSTFQTPLVHTNEDLDNAMWAADHDLPIVYLGGGTTGSSAPVTGAGALVVALAGMLSGLAIVQLKKRGAAVCVGGVPQAMDPRTVRPSHGSPDDIIADLDQALRIS